ncbi:MAG: twin-arginine translocation signal domain-containing protein, partial [Mailhella sp.]|nr:twin-arginine translocation signal domain-containing protein [Mailhella sp.]
MKQTISRRSFLRSAAALAGGAVLFGASTSFSSPGMTCAESEGLPSFIDPRGWSGEAWKAALPSFKKILEHPFVKGLADGSLPEDVFAFYIRQ